MTHPFVGKLRASTGTVSSERTYTTKHGTVATMDTSAIGRAAVQQVTPAASHDERKAEKATGSAPQADWSLPLNANGGVRAVAKYCGVLSPDADATRITAKPVGELHTEPIGELRVDPSLPGHRTADRGDGFCTYQILKGYLDARRPPLPSQTAVDAMTTKHHATIRRLAEQQRDWAVGLLGKLDKAAATNA